MNEAGHTVLFAIPIHTSIALCLSPWALQQIDKLRRAFVWAGDVTVARGRCRVAWTIACRPKELGGLGISDLRRTGIALRARWLWRDRRRGMLLPPAEPSVLALFHAATLVMVGNRESVLFWTDRWIRGKSIQFLAPLVFVAVRPRRRRTTVAEALPANAWLSHLSGAATLRMMVEIAALCDLLDQVVLSAEPDTFSWSLSESGEYSAASAYGAMFFGSVALPGAKLVWKTAAPPRVRYFFWLTLHGRCWTGHRRFRHGLQDSDICIVCDEHSETMDHILSDCPFSREVWHRCLDRLHLAHPLQLPHGRALDWWTTSRKLVPRTLRKGLDSFVLLVGWSLWKERNARTFRGESSSASVLFLRIWDDASFWSASGFRGLGALLAAAG